MNAPQQTQQFDMMKIAQAKNERMAVLFGEALDNNFFPKERLSEIWKQIAVTALMKSQPIAHRLSLAEFAKVVACDSSADITLFQFGVLSNAIEAVSPEQLGLTAEGYVEVVKEVVSHIEYYSKVVTKIKEDLEIKVAEEFKMKLAAAKGGNGLKRIAGEA